MGDPGDDRGAPRGFAALGLRYTGAVSGILGIGVGLLVLGLIGLVFFPWGGAVAALVGLVLIVLFLLGVGKTMPRRGA